ncbi:MAG: undecaprenyl-diphosphate phosphatase [Rivularia sp. (in: cyanobacteria)]|jgi:undecaprenyl-diphosphatase
MAVSKRLLFSLLMVGSAVLSVATFPLKVLSQDASTPVVDGASQMNLWQGIFLGFVQGATEFLPISSTAHLKAVPVALGWGDPGSAFSAAIQLGSIVAVLWYFWGDLKRVLTGAYVAIRRKDYQDNDFRIALGIAIGTLPIVVLGLLLKIVFEEFYENTVRGMGVIAVVSIVMGILLGLAEMKGSRQRNFDKLTMGDGILMGCAQALALVPGASRSGSTLTAGLFMGLERGTAARFSFLLGIPAITLAGLISVKDLLEVGVDSSEILTLVASVISSGIFSYLAIAWLVEFLKTKSTWIFVWYRVIFGIAILAGLYFNVLENA